MENSSNNDQLFTVKQTWFNFPIFVSRILKAGFSLLVFGAIFIVLIKFNSATDGITNSVEDVISNFSDPWPLAGSTFVLAALTLIGVPLIPAAFAGAAVWFFMQAFL